MDKSNSILNRLNKTALNWSFIESIEIGNDKAVIYYISSRTKEIRDQEEVRALDDLISTFPNIADPETRRIMKQRMKGVQTDIPQPMEPPQPQRTFRTDIVEK